jgi:hypothetical protein
MSFEVCTLTDYLQLTVEWAVFRYMDVSKHYREADIREKALAVQWVRSNDVIAHLLTMPLCQCRDNHECLSLYEGDWLVHRLMIQTLQRTHKKYAFEDWSRERLLEAIRGAKNMDTDEESVSTAPPTVVSY